MRLRGPHRHQQAVQKEEVHCAGAASPSQHCEGRGPLGGDRLSASKPEEAILQEIRRVGEEYQAADQASKLQGFPNSKRLGHHAQ